MPTRLRGPLKFQRTAPPTAGAVGQPYPYLNEAPLEAVDQLPVVANSLTGEDTPRCFGYVWQGTTYPGPYAEAAVLESLQLTSPTGGACSAAEIADQLGGGQRLSTAAADNAQAYLSGTTGNFKVAAGKRIFFSVRLALHEADPTVGEVFAGLSADTLATDLATPPVDGIFFLKADTSGDFTFTVRKASTSTSITTVFAKAGIALPLTDVAFELGFLVDLGGNINNPLQGAISCYVNGILAGSVASSDANIPTVALKFALGRQAGAISVHTLDVFQCLCQEEL